MIAKKVNEQQVETQQENYELFEERVMKDIEGNDVTVLASVGVYNKADLLQQKQSYEKYIAELDAKLALMV